MATRANEAETSETANLDPDAVAFFEERIRPVLVKHCYECHSAAAAEAKGGLRVDSREGLRRGGDSGAAIVPGDAAASLLVSAIRHDGLEMPPKRRLPDEVIADVEKWIAGGAHDPRDRPPSAEEAAAVAWSLAFDQRKTWWSLQPPMQSALPEMADDHWSRGPIDRFIAAKFLEEGLAPATRADVRTLARRLSFVLTGLPPDADDVERVAAAFDSPLTPAAEAALAEYVDRLLASPHFGERFARHWMDVVRYTDTYGYEWDNPAKGAWQYRDYLVRAFNADVGYDQLVREQLAGDLLDPPRIDGARQLNESLIGPMFYHLGEHRHGDSLEFNGIHQEMIHNKIDALSKTFLAMTVACTRCHDHKLDAVSQRDYYALAGVLMTPRWTSRVVDAPDKNAARIARLKELRSIVRNRLKDRWGESSQRFPDEIAAALRTAESTRDESDMTGNAATRDSLWRKAFGLLAESPKSAANAPSADTPKPLPIESVVYPVARLFGDRKDKNVTTIWTELRSEWQAASAERRKQNAERFSTLAGFGDDACASPSDIPNGWTIEGDGLLYGGVRDGEPLVALEGPNVVQSILPRGLHTHALSPRLSGSIRTPSLHTIPQQHVSVLAAGGDWAGSLTVVQNAFQSERVAFFPTNEFGWRSFGTFHSRSDWRVRVEMSTADLNPNFPPRTGLARAGSIKLPERDYGEGKRSWLSVTRVVAHDQTGAPQDELEAFADLYSTAEAPDSDQAAAERIARWLSDTVARWVDEQSRPGDVAVLNWLLAGGLLPNDVPDDTTLGELLAEYRRVESSIEPARTVNSMDERAIEPYDYAINIRGDVDREGDRVSHGFLELFREAPFDIDRADRSRNDLHASAPSASTDRVLSSGSGRLQIADSLIDADHPLTARVYVNRVWQWVFGEGLVRTPSDFGQLGDMPSHPELLDYLARRFVADGWSTKQLVRQLVLSETFRQSGTAGEAALQADPDNRLWHHYPTRRLEAESIRDAILAVSGRLERRIGGSSIDPPRAKEDPSKRLFAGPVDGDGRRSIYMRITIMEPPKFLAAFNQPSPKIPTGRRDVTNVPAQALAMMNDPFVREQAELWGATLAASAPVNEADANGERKVERRVDRMFRTAFGRAASDAELQRWSNAARELSAALNGDENAGDTGDDNANESLENRTLDDPAVWIELAHAIFNSKEFIYFR